MRIIAKQKMFWVAVVVVIFGISLFVLPYLLPTNFSLGLSEVEAPKIEVEKVPHVSTPTAVKGIYMTSCVASMPTFRAKLVKLIDETELNSVVIDIKDYSGTISVDFNNPEYKSAYEANGCKVKDMKDFIKSLHEKNIYVIARITSFQDPFVAKQHPEWAIKKKSDKTVVWKDRKGISFIDANNRDMWKYLADLGTEAYKLGFDEINFDYIRFPSDGDMKDIYFPWSNSILTTSTSTMPKAVVMKGFFEYLHSRFGGTETKISADLFGMTTTNTDDLNIGQLLEDAAPNFDYIAPMVYPSHYPSGFNNYKDVNAHPYDIVKFSMDKAVARLILASTTPLKLRPWLQDNDYPVPYTPEMVRAQMKATYDAGLNSWMLWDAANTYTRAALLAE
ncbi:MAG: putative glycoside hydrolase [bacterium]